MPRAEAELLFKGRRRLLLLLQQHHRRVARPAPLLLRAYAQCYASKEKERAALHRGAASQDRSEWLLWPPVALRQFES